MINEANVPSSACRLWRIFQVETSTPPRKLKDYRAIIDWGQVSSLVDLQGQRGVADALHLGVARKSGFKEIDSNDGLKGGQRDRTDASSAAASFSHG